MLFMSTDEHKMMHTYVVYEHRWEQDDAHRRCLWAQDEHRWAQDVIYEHKKHKKQLFFLSCFLLAQNVKEANKNEHNFLWA